MLLLCIAFCASVSLADQESVEDESTTASDQEVSECSSEMKRPRLSLAFGKGQVGMLVSLSDIGAPFMSSAERIDDIDEILWGVSVRDEKSVGHVNSYSNSFFENNGQAFYGRGESSVSRAEMVLEYLILMRERLKSQAELPSQTVVVRRVHRSSLKNQSALTHSDLELLQALKLINEFFSFSRWSVSVEVISQLEEDQKLQKQSLQFSRYSLASRGDFNIDPGLLSWLKETGDSLVDKDVKPSRLELLDVLIADLEQLLGGLEVFDTKPAEPETMVIESEDTVDEVPEGDDSTEDTVDKDDQAEADDSVGSDPVDQQLPDISADSGQERDS